jgi:hypothetical protein
MALYKSFQDQLVYLSDVAFLCDGFVNPIALAGWCHGIVMHLAN